jgi:protein-tyrosine phosphatase
MLVSGRVDSHSHILPGIDDGCPDLEASLACVRQFIAAGYVGTICTPHVIPKLYPRNTPNQIRVWVAELQAELTRQGLDYQLWAGGEFVLAPENWEFFEQNGVPTLGRSRAVLMDWWGATWPDHADVTIDRLLAEGYQPILAHPERMKLPEAKLHALVDSLTARGVWLQGNLNSLSGGEGAQSQALGHDWLQNGRYYLLASDAHHPERLDGRFAGLQVAIDLVGLEQVTELVSRRTRALVE